MMHDPELTGQASLKGSVNYRSFSLGQTKPPLGRGELTVLTWKLNINAPLRHFGQLQKQFCQKCKS